MSTIPTLDAPRPGPSVSEIDREMAQLAGARDAALDPAAAGDFELRRQALLSDRAVALARSQASLRRQEVEQALAAHARFAQLEATLPGQLAAAAAAIDAWVVTGAALLDAYDDVLRQCTEVQDLALVAPVPGRELDLLMAHGRLDVHDVVEQCLAHAEVLQSRAVRQPPITVAVYSSRRLQQFLAAARDRLPPLDHHPAGTGDHLAATA